MTAVLESTRSAWRPNCEAAADAVAALMAAGMVPLTVAALNASAAAARIEPADIRAALVRRGPITAAAVELAKHEHTEPQRRRRRTNRPTAAMSVPAEARRLCDGAVAVVSERSGYTPGELRGTSKRHPLTYWRHVACVVAYRASDCGISLPSLSDYFGWAHHSSALYAVERVRGNPSLADLVDELATVVKARSSSVSALDALGEGS